MPRQSCAMTKDSAEAGVFPEHFCDLRDPRRHVTGVYPLEDGVFSCLLVGAGGFVIARA